MTRPIFIFTVIASFAVVLPMSNADEPTSLAQRGLYVLQIAGCPGCHSISERSELNLSGGLALPTTFGTFYTPNITPDPTYGIGRWSELDFIRALTKGVAPDGSHYYPIFPYNSYTNMSRADLHAMWFYLRTIPPLAQPNKHHEKAWYLNRLTSWVWQQMYFKHGPWVYQIDKNIMWNRGAYIANALAHCGECHTPRNIMGAVKTRMAFAGTSNGPEGIQVPNITSDRDTGIGNWTQENLLDFIQTGKLPDGSYIGGLMAEIVNKGLSKLSPYDAKALATYIANLPPIHNDIATH